MRVSYLATLYNKAAFLPHVAAALQSQEGDFEKEYIFVDDGSTDGSADLAEQLFAGYPRLQVIRQANAGPAAAFNRGLQAATGTYLKPLDGDDLLAPGATIRLLTVMQKTGCPIGFFPADLQQPYDVAQPVADVLASFPPLASPEPVGRRIDDMLAISLRRATINPTMWMGETDLVRRSGGCDERVFVQDYSVELRMARLAPFAELRESLMKFPAAAPGRVSGNEAQILHDVTMAALLFMADNPGLTAQQRKLGMKRAAMRSWAWERRRNPVSLPRRLRLCGFVVQALLGTLRPTPGVRSTMLETYRRDRDIRLTRKA